MPNPRIALTPAAELALTTQVGGRCPKCDDALFYKKKGRDYKDYDIAHIYPLNPTPAETIELTDVERLHPDSNHSDNLIPLCTSCHKRFDKPRTSEEYNEMLELKRALIVTDRTRQLGYEHQLDGSIRDIVEALHQATPASPGGEALSYEPKSLDTKFDATLPAPTRQKIRNNVRDYFQSVHEAFLTLEGQEPSAAQIVFTQVRTYYLSQQRRGLSQSQIFSGVTDWIYTRSRASSRDTAEIIAAFFVQNCEVFE